jgi:putative hydrolase of the HAD superfamily
MSQFSTVLWDIGGVLLTNGWDHNERKVVFDKFELSAEDRQEFEQRHEVENDPWEKGTIDFDQYLKRTLFFKPRPFSPEAVRKAIEDQSMLIPDTAMPVLRELHEKGGVRMGQLNNESRELNDLRLARFGLRQYLSVFLCSGYVRLRKPDPAIYKMALEVLQKPASEVVFIDDREKNAAEARALGLHAIQYTGSAALRAELQTLGLL